MQEELLYSLLRENPEGRQPEWPQAPSLFLAHSFPVLSIHSGHRLAAELQPLHLQWEPEAGGR